MNILLNQYKRYYNSTSQRIEKYKTRDLSPELGWTTELKKEYFECLHNAEMATDIDERYDFLFDALKIVDTALKRVEL